MGGDQNDEGTGTPAVEEAETNGGNGANAAEEPQRQPAHPTLGETQPLHPPPPKDGAFPAGTVDRRGALDNPWVAPGHIPKPQEKQWDDEAESPFDGIDRSSPFEGRPPSKVPRPDEPPDEEAEQPGPGQPLRRAPRSDTDGNG